MADKELKYKGGRVMEHKFKVGDKVRIKTGLDLESICIFSNAAGLEATILKDNGVKSRAWSNSEYDNTPTYSVSNPLRKGGIWRMPEAFIELA